MPWALLKTVRDCGEARTEFPRITFPLSTHTICRAIHTHPCLSVFSNPCLRFVQELVELINKDYADFVNLSANLVGLDRAIAGIREPLNSLRADITVRACV